MRSRDLSVRQRLSITSATVAVLLLILAGSVVISVVRIAALQREQATVIAPRAEAADQLESAVYRQAIAFRNYVITLTPADLAVFTGTRREVADRMERLRNVPKRPSGERLFNEIRAASAEHQKNLDWFLELAQQQASREELQKQELVTSQHRTQVLQKVQTLAADQRRQNATAERAIAEATRRLSLFVLLVTGLIVAVAFLSMLWTSRAVAEPAGRLIRAAETMRAGSFTEALALDEGEKALPYRDELKEASRIFGAMASTLQNRENALSAHARLSAALGSSLDVGEVASRALDELTRHVRAEVGAVYIMDADGVTLRPVATVALEGAIGPLRCGEGLPGLAAATRGTQLVTDIPRDTEFLVKLGFDSAPPRSFLAAPMVVKDRVIGVIALASLHDFDAEAVAFVERGAGQLAITADNALAHGTIAALGAELTETNKALQVQNEELQAQGEELRAQSEELQTQTEQLQAQSEELQVQNEELATQTEQLREQQEALQRANAALTDGEVQKNRFLAVLGHELRNPLAAISGAVALLSEGNATASESDDLREVIRRQTAHLCRMVDDLLDVSRITNGKIELVRRPIELGQTVERCIAAFAHDSNGEWPAIVLKKDGEVWVDADETRVSQIVANLIQNAQKFTPPTGTVSLRVTRDGSNAVVQVSDNGLGIDAGLLPKIFDLFVQGDIDGTRKKGGLGLGLPLVKTLAELHGGTVRASSDGAGRGTTMVVELPALDGPPDIMPKAAPAPRLATKKSIVLIEDNADVRQMLSLRLTLAGHAVVQAFDGPSGVQAVHDSRPEVALVDLDLPGFDGFEVARRVRSDQGLRAVRLIALSGYGRPEDRERALSSGFDEHLVKPVEFDRLVETFGSPSHTADVTRPGS